MASYPNRKPKAPTAHGNKTLKEYKLNSDLPADGGPDRSNARTTTPRLTMETMPKKKKGR